MKPFPKLSLYFLIAIFLLNVGIWHSINNGSKGSGGVSNNNLKISFLDIGQGDAIFIEAPNGMQVLVDGGPGKNILAELGSQMPFYDKSIDMIVVTNPDKDHIGGFLDVLERYEVSWVVEPGTISKTETYGELEKLVEKEKAEKLIARRGTNIMLDPVRNIYIKILFPDKDVKTYSTNDGSIVAKLVYGNTSVLLQGDAPQKTEYYLLGLDKEDLNVDILKTGHHGSYTSTAKEYVMASTPEYAVISLGGDNNYGHPHKETLNTLNSLNVPILRTDEKGTITFVSDGNKFELLR